MRAFWRWLRRHPPQASPEAVEAAEGAAQRAEEAQERRAKAVKAGRALDAHLRANHFDDLLASVIRPRP